MNEPDIKDMVRVKRGAFPDDEQKHVMYAGWYGVVKRRVGALCLVDSDEFTHRTNYLQGVSFKAWIPEEYLEPVTLDMLGFHA